MEQSERHLNRWSVETVRDYVPYYFLDGGRYDSVPLPPVTVQVSAVFDDNASAVAFETAVRELLEKL